MQHPLGIMLMAMNTSYLSLSTPENVTWMGEYTPVSGLGGLKDTPSFLAVQLGRLVLF